MTRKSKTPKPTSRNALERVAQQRAPTEREKAAMADAMVAQNVRRAPVRVSITNLEEGRVEIKPEHNDAGGWADQLRETFGTRSNSFAEVIMQQVEVACRKRGTMEVSSTVDNYALAIMAAIAPRDEWEAITAANIIGTHTLAMEMLGKARHSTTLEATGFYVAQHAKLTKSARTLSEALDKHRHGGKQQVIVKHVYVTGNAVVGDGTQAVFGGIERGASPEKADQSRALPQGGALSAEVWSQDPPSHALPSPCGAGPEALPDAWRD
jgi:hypothetical protein